MTYASLKELLTKSRMFSDLEVHAIVRTCGGYTVGCAVIACEILKIELTGPDIDVLFELYHNEVGEREDDRIEMLRRETLGA